MSDLKTTIETAWEARNRLSGDAYAREEVRAGVAAVIDLLDRGRERICTRAADGQWTVHQWLKKAVLLSFKLTPNRLVSGGPDGGHWFDKVAGKFEGWDEAAFEAAGFRAVPTAIVRKGSFVAPGAVLMPSYVNIGAYVGAGSMVDTWATVGSCAQIGENVHISGGAGIGGVLEPLQANPVIIEDNCFIGARAEVAEGVIVREGAVLSMGVYLGASTKIVDRETGEIHRGEVPPFAVVVPGTIPAARAMPGNDWGPSLYCAVIVKRVDAQTRAKTGVNEILREVVR